jgi:hypothetical protein
MKTAIFTLFILPATAFISPQRAFTRSTTVAKAEPSEKDLELTRKVILDFMDENDSSVAGEAPEKKTKSEKGKKAAEGE